MQTNAIEYREASATARDAADVEQVSQWLSRLDDALQAGDAIQLEALFQENSHWRDLVAFTWSVTPCDGRANIVSHLLRTQSDIQAHGFKVATGRMPPRRVTRAGIDLIEAIFQFETRTGRCLGVVRLPAAQPDKAWVISTSLRELKGFEEPVDDRRPDGATTRIFGGEPWAVRREKEQRYDDRDPAVLIVGGGHNGLELAARLRLLGVDALVVERLARVGDVWRKRYGALALHNQIALNHLPYMPYPASWPKFIPKDMLGDWIESYAKAMSCNVWTNADFIRGRYDEKTGLWTAHVRLVDGSERVLHPRHLVFANGVVGEPLKPDVPGLKDFEGEVVHSHHFDTGAKYRGRNVVVIGVGNTAHDIAQDLHGHGANVTMVQRGPLTVFSVKAASINHSIFYNEGLSLDDCDLIVSCNTFAVLLRGYKLATQRMLEIDKELLQGLSARGFKLDLGAEGGGHQMKVRMNHGGYYLNVGCSDLIVNGEVGLLQYENLERFVAGGVLMKDGQLKKADLVVTATGYQRPQDVIRERLGGEIAEKIGPVWGMDQDGEMCNMYKPTPQKGLWFIGGGFAQGRVWSHYMALQIKAREAGLINDAIPPAKPTLHPLTGTTQEYMVSYADSGVAEGGATAGTDGL
jgi:hypothetical protein